MQLLILYLDISKECYVWTLVLIISFLSKEKVCYAFLYFYAQDMTFIIDTYGKNWAIMARKCLIQRENLGKNYSKNIIWFIDPKKEISNVPKSGEKWEIHGRTFVLYIYINIFILFFCGATLLFVTNGCKGCCTCNFYLQHCDSP